jgi:hypothetical protein
MRKAGVDTSVIMAITGHKTMAICRKRANLSKNWEASFISKNWRAKVYELVSKDSEERLNYRVIELH